MADNVDKDRIEGKGKQGVGSVKEMAGKVTGNERLEAEGNADKAEGKIQDTAGRAKDKVREIADKAT